MVEFSLLPSAIVYAKCNLPSNSLPVIRKLVITGKCLAYSGEFKISKGSDFSDTEPFTVFTRTTMFW